MGVWGLGFRLRVEGSKVLGFWALGFFGCLPMDGPRACEPSVPCCLAFHGLEAHLPPRGPRGRGRVKGLGPVGLEISRYYGFHSQF